MMYNKLFLFSLQVMVVGALGVHGVMVNGDLTVPNRVVVESE